MWACMRSPVPTPTGCAHFCIIWNDGWNHTLGIQYEKRLLAGDFWVATQMGGKESMCLCPKLQPFEVVWLLYMHWHGACSLETVTHVAFSLSRQAIAILKLVARFAMFQGLAMKIRLWSPLSEHLNTYRIWPCQYTSYLWSDIRRSPVPSFSPCPFGWAAWSCPVSHPTALSLSLTRLCSPPLSASALALISSSHPMAPCPLRLHRASLEWQYTQAYIPTLLPCWTLVLYHVLLSQGQDSSRLPLNSAARAQAMPFYHWTQPPPLPYEVIRPLPLNLRLGDMGLGNSTSGFSKRNLLELLILNFIFCFL